MVRRLCGEANVSMRTSSGLRRALMGNSSKYSKSQTRDVFSEPSGAIQ